MIKQKATYVDGFVLVVPAGKLAAYRRLAALAGRIWRKHGALDYKECVIDDPKPQGVKLPFAKLAQAKKGELVIFAYIAYKSKAHRNQVNAKVMADPAMNDPKYQDMPMPFDMDRMSFGGFKVLVDA